MYGHASVGGLVLAGAFALFAGPAAAKAPPSTVTCGQTLTQSVRLTDDLTNCAGSGLVIGAGGITVDLNGHTIDGTVPRTDCDFSRAFRNGVENPGGFDDVTIRNGTVQQFDVGVTAGSATAGMSDSRVHHLTLRDNRVNGVSLGSGAGAAATANNRIDHNIVSSDSACADGLDLNTGEHNRYSDNRVQHVGSTGIVICCGESTDANVVERNTVSDTGREGILVFSSGQARIAGNVLRDIGSDGVSIIAGRSRDSVVERNTIRRTRGAGVVVASCCEDDPLMIPAGVRITRNTLAQVADGIIAFETDAITIDRNEVTGAGRFGDPEAIGWGIILDGVSQSVVDRNEVSGGRGPAIQLGAQPDQDPSSRPVTANAITRNVATRGGADGIRIVDVARDTTVERNTADENAADGIRVLSPFTTLLRNTADDNALFGIEAVPGVTDGGGNRASGNGAATQCTGVACS